MATVDNEGAVTTHSGPGDFTVRAAMVKGALNHDEAKVLAWGYFGDGLGIFWFLVHAAYAK